MAWRLASFVVALLVWQQAAAPAPSPAATWPPAGVYQMRDVDVGPRLLQEVKPNYTGAAMRARIQGTVMLNCVVLADGTVGDVRVAKSLDAALGLDNEAIAAVKQWRFSPATKAGSPVPIAVNVSLSFALKDATTAAPTLKWPDGFDAPLDDATKQAEWREDAFEVLNLRVKIAYPSGWAIVKSPNERTMVEVHRNGDLTSLSISPPKRATESLDRPMAPDELRRVADRMTASAAAGGMTVESLGFGQAPAASHVWAWQAFRMPDLATPNMPASTAARAKETFDGGRIWMFHGTAADQMFDVSCLLGVPRRIAEPDRAKYIADQAAMFGEILRRMSISIVQ